MKGMSIIAKTITRLTLGLILLFGMYIFLHGHISHGVGFAGGVIVTLGFIHIMLAYGREETFKRIDESRSLLLQNIGLSILVVLSVGGMFFGKPFLSNFINTGQPYNLFSSGIIILFNAGICIAVAGSLFLVFLTLVNYEEK